MIPMSDSPLIALTGASGLLGRPLYDMISRDSRYRVRGAAFTRSGAAFDRVDLTSPADAEAWLDGIRPSVLIHLAAERRPDVYARNPESADRLNITATEELALSCAARGIALLYLSTNYVFDGSAPPYEPEDEPNPLNDYGKGKLGGERAVIPASERNRVLRVPMLYGPSESLDESSVTVLARAFMHDEGPVLLDVRQTRYPACTIDVAAAISGLIPGLIDGSLPGPHLHFCPAEAFTKRDMGEILAPFVGADPARAVADNRPPAGAPRPRDVRLSCPRMDDLGLLKFTPFREALASSMESIRNAGGLS